MRCQWQPKILFLYLIDQVNGSVWHDWVLAVNDNLIYEFLYSSSFFVQINMIDRVWDVNDNPRYHSYILFIKYILQFDMIEYGMSMTTSDTIPLDRDVKVTNFFNFDYLSTVIIDIWTQWRRLSISILDFYQPFKHIDMIDISWKQSYQITASLSLLILVIRKKLVNNQNLNKKSSSSYWSALQQNSIV